MLSSKHFTPADMVTVTFPITLEVPRDYMPPVDYGCLIRAREPNVDRRRPHHLGFNKAMKGLDYGFPGLAEYIIRETMIALYEAVQERLAQEAEQAKAPEEYDFG